MKKQIGMSVAGVLGLMLGFFVVPILLALHRVVLYSGRFAVSRADEHAVWLLFAVLSIGMALAGWVLATYQARRLIGQVEKVVDIAERYSRGESFELLAPTGIVEIDRLAQTLHDSATRANGAVIIERQFSADVSHQLRTPLTSLRLKLDALDPVRWSTEEMQPFRNDLKQMEQTIDHLLNSDGATRGLDSVVVLGDVLCRALERWRPILAGASRPIRLVECEPAVVQGSAVVFDQILDVLICNAHRHGQGTITVAIRPLVGGTAIDVKDEGTGLVGADSEQIFQRRVGGQHGLGLSIGRTLAEAEGARLIVSNLLPTTFSLVALNAVGNWFDAAHRQPVPRAHSRLVS